MTPENSEKTLHVLVEKYIKLGQKEVLMWLTQNYENPNFDF